MSSDPSVLDRFSAPTRSWFASTFAAPTDAQLLGWEAIGRGDHTLIHAPTGSGKTLAAFLWAIDRVAAEPVPEERRRCRVLYVSPMKALAYDIERNLRSPLAGIGVAAARLGITVPEITVAMRTGDTPARDRQAIHRHPPDILITTPESLFLMLTSQVAEILESVRWVIVDEIHSVAGSKRGSHLSLTMERLTEITTTPPQRIGLSATQRPLDQIAAFLGGGTAAGEPGDPGPMSWRPRPVTVVDAPWEKQLDVQIVVPVADMTRPEETPTDRDAENPDTRQPDPDQPELQDPARRSIWPAVYPRLLELVLANRSTLLFVNSRGLAERLAGELNQLAGEELVQAHHGSVSRTQRLEIENRLKEGSLRGVVATSTLELGIDMATIDLVVMVESPGSVARGLQRVGRAGHQVGAPSVGKVFPKHRGDLLESAVVVDRMNAGAIEPTRIPANALDVLAQQLVACVARRPRQVDDLYALVRGAGPYRDLTRGAFDAVLDMLAGRYPSDEFSELRPRVVWDRVSGTLEGRGNAQLLAVTNAGTIPDRGLYTVTLPEGGRVGELDEEMVYESRPGDVFVLGSTSWRISEITHDRVVVTPAPGESAGKMPFWHGDSPGRPLELGRAVGEFVRTIGSMPAGEAHAALTGRYRLDGWAADNLIAFVTEEREATGALPTDRTIVIERFRDEIGDWRMVVLSPFGARVHAPWALAARHRLRAAIGSEVDVIWSDDGIVFRFPDVDEPPPPNELLLAPDEVDDLLVEEVADSALFTSRFRESAARALLLPRRRPGSRTPLWLQRRKAAGLLEIAKRYPAFPIVLETYREILQDHFDVPALIEVLGDIAARRTRIVEVELDGPSPFASSLMFEFIASFMYEYDAPVAETRAAALTLDRRLLAELLGDPQFRDLLDAEVIGDVEAELQRLTPERKAGSADQLHDLLRDLGPLTPEAVAARCLPPGPEPWLEQLTASRRIVTVRLGGVDHLATIEDVARLRDALGASPPAWVPPSLLEPVADPLGDVVGRYARTHGPFHVDEAATALGLPVAAVAEVLRRLAGTGRVHEGAFRPGGTGTEWIEADVLRRVRRRTLAALRSEIEAVEPHLLARFLPAWHGIEPARGRSGAGTAQVRLTDAIRRLQGAVVPAADLEREILPARLGYEPAMLDLLLASGEVVWIGQGSLGSRNGKVALFRRTHVTLLLAGTGAELPDTPIHQAIRRHLAERGASFFPELYRAAGGGDPGAVVEAVWDLVWSGEVTNDTMAPLRAMLSGTPAGGRRGPSSKRGGPALPSASPPSVSGRWYLVDDLRTAAGPVTPEQRATAVAEQMLERHGIVTRDGVLAESVPGGFSGLYPVLATMEDVGGVRRGYFIEGQGGSQFALPGAVDRLRGGVDAGVGGGVQVLAAADPANAYGAALPWPAHPSGLRPARRSGAHVVLDDGVLAAWVDRGGKRVLGFGDDPAAAVAGLVQLAQRPRSRGERSFSVDQIDGDPATATGLGLALGEAGFAPGYRGLSWRATEPRRRTG